MHLDDVGAERSRSMAVQGLDSGVTLGKEASTDSMHTRRPGNPLPHLPTGEGQRVSLRGETPGGQG